MQYLIDTSAYSHFNRGDIRLKPLFLDNNELFIPLIVIGELRAGFAAGTKTDENEHLLQLFLDDPSVQSLSLTDQSTQIYSSVYASLKKIGKPIGVNDMWIAAMAIEHNLHLITTDSDFIPIKGLRLAKF